MARIQSTLIEQLDRQFTLKDQPGLRQQVDLRLDGDAELTEIQGEIEGKWGVKIPLKTLSNYKQRRWLPQKQRIENMLEVSESIMRLVEKHGPTRTTEAYIFERLAQAKEEGVEVAPSALLREQRLRDQLKIQERRTDVYEKQVELNTRNLEFQVAQLKEKQERIAGILTEAQKAAQSAPSPETGGTVKPFDAASVYRQISKVIGVGQVLEERNERAPETALSIQEREDLMRDTE